MPGSDIYTGTLDLLILRALLDGEQHGYAIGRWIRERSRDVLSVEEGVLYPALHRLERRKLLAARWGRSETGRRARFYHLTPAGTQFLRDEAARCVEHSRALITILGRRSAT